MFNQIYGIAFVLSLGLFSTILASPVPASNLEPGLDLVKRADTPNFYLVASSTGSNTDLKPVRFDSSGYGTTLSGSGPVLTLNFNAGNLQTSDGTKNAYVQFITGSECGPYGPVAFVSVSGGNTNKCGSKNGFNLQSYLYNAQLGAELTYQFTGAFFACGNDQTIYYEATPPTGPSGLTCTKVHLFTVPVETN